MVDLVPLQELFDIKYGNQLDRNKLKNDPDGVNFVSRSSANLGIDGKVERIAGVAPHAAGTITATMGGTYLLSSFIQPEPFYTGQNIKVLTPRFEMTFEQKAFYCLAIAHNRRRYTSHGREANKTFDKLLVPRLGSIPAWIEEVQVSAPAPCASGAAECLRDLSTWKPFSLESLFTIERGRGPRKTEICLEGNIPFITSIDSNNGLTGYVNGSPEHAGRVITVNRNGSVGEAFYQERPFSTTEDVHIFVPKFHMTPLVALFMTTLIRRERYRFGYGRKWGLERMNKSTVRLPVESNGGPDWPWIHKFMASLPYSAHVEA
ncbi:restriction endonuclease subunit S [Sphingobium sp. TomMM35A]